MNNEDKEKDSDTFKCIAALIGILIGFVSAGFLTKKAIDKYYEPEQGK
jgi:hypothetical protein